MRVRAAVRRRLLALGVIVTMVALVQGVAAGPAARADTAPRPPVTVPTVSADALPTVQINGVVWDQVVVGNRVYVTGEFTSARPAGSPPGTAETPRSNILAYDLTTGELVTSWAPSLNAVGYAIGATSDGSRIIVGGSFTKVNGVNRYRIAELDATTGALVTGFDVVVDSRVRTLAVSGDTLYFGGIFSIVSGHARTRLAAVSASTGAVLDWGATADAEPLAMTAPRGSGKVVVGGRFTALNGAANTYGMAALDAATGRVLPWSIDSVVRDGGAHAGIYSLTSDGSQVYGTGYTFGSGGNFEGTFAATVSDGSLVYVTGCRGDTYDSFPMSGVLYSVSHAHDCSTIGDHPQTKPLTFQRASAQTTTAAPSGMVNSGGAFAGLPAPQMLLWAPTLQVGTYTGQSQAAWTVEGTKDYVLLGGEFLKVNGVSQEGLVRFAVRDVAPNKQGPQGGSALTPALNGVGPGALRVSWTAAWDRDNQVLSYQVLRGDSLSGSTVVASFDRSSAWWRRPTVSFVDRGAPEGSSQTYRIRVRDALGNVVVGNPATGTVPSGTTPASRYADAVLRDGADDFWRLGERSGSTGYDWTGGDDLTLAAGATRGVGGALSGDTDTATSLPGTARVPATTRVSRQGLQTFSVEAWFTTTTTRGGKIIGFGDSDSGLSTHDDRHVYMTNSGHLVFGVNPGVVRTVSSPRSYNDGRWHHVVATLGVGGQLLYVDGAQVAGEPTSATAENLAGYWRIGGDSLSSWPSAPSSNSFAGAIDEVAVYGQVLGAGTVKAHYQIGIGSVTNQAPVASFTAITSARTASFDATASADPDGTVASYDWDFGDGSTGTGATVAHTYAADGAYTVKLTVTDDAGATGTTTHAITVRAPASGQTIAADSFERAVTSGWGTADTGGPWSISASGSTFSVADGAAREAIPAGHTVTTRLSQVEGRDVDSLLTLWSDNTLTGGGAYVSAIVRSGTAGEYRTRMRIQADGTVTAQITAVQGTTETALTAGIVVPGITYTTGAKLRVRTQVSGASPTTVRYRIWLAGSAEPTTWLQTVTDSTVGPQTAGGVGMLTYISGSATQAQVIRFDDVTVVTL